MELTEVLADVTMDITDGTELEAQVKIRQLKEFKVFDALRLSIEVLTEVAVELIAELIVELMRIKLV